MAKRFTDTDLWDKEWYMDLAPKHKLLIRFLFDKCDPAGVWDPNWRLATNFIGELMTQADLAFLGNQVEVLDNGKVFIPDFIEFQYGKLSDSCIPHRKIIALLNKYNLLDRVYIPYTKGTDTLKEKKREEEDKEEENTERGSGGKQNRRQRLTPAEPNTKQQKTQYDEVLETVKLMTDVRSQKETLANFIVEQQPAFIEPYADLWNVTVQSYGLAQIETISDSRLKKFKARVREPSFDFIKILTEIRVSDYLRGKTTDWKVDWDWIMTNDTNYLKIIEGKYRNAQN